MSNKKQKIENVQASGGLIIGNGDENRNSLKRKRILNDIDDEISDKSKDFNMDIDVDKDQALDILIKRGTKYRRSDDIVSNILHVSSMQNAVEEQKNKIAYVTGTDSRPFLTRAKDELSHKDSVLYMKLEKQNMDGIHSAVKEKKSDEKYHDGKCCNGVQIEDVKDCANHDQDIQHTSNKPLENQNSILPKIEKLSSASMKLVSESGITPVTSTTEKFNNIVGYVDKIELTDLKKKTLTVPQDTSIYRQHHKNTDTEDDISPKTMNDAELYSNQSRWYTKYFQSVPKHTNFAKLLLLVVLFFEMIVSSYIILRPAQNLFLTTSVIHTRFTLANSPLQPPPSNPNAPLTSLTLREYLTHSDGFHLGMAPAFFGFYAYFGALIVWDETLHLLPTSPHSINLVKSVAGASAGAMSASLIAAGIQPSVAATYVSALNLSSFADPLGLFGILRGTQFENMLREFVLDQRRMNSNSSQASNLNHVSESMGMEDTLIPLAVSGFDLLSMTGKILTEGDMAIATRASATFPVLFQPVPVWNKKSNWIPESVLIDGGIQDPYGLNGLSSFLNNNSSKRIVNLSVGHITLNPKNPPPGPSDLTKITGQPIQSMVSISLINTPKCGPWAMKNGPRAVEAARKAMSAVLDLPMYRGKEPGHYEVIIDASSFVDSWNTE